MAGRYFGTDTSAAQWPGLSLQNNWELELNCVPEKPMGLNGHSDTPSAMKLTSFGSLLLSPVGLGQDQAQL